MTRDGAESFLDIAGNHNKVVFRQGGGSVPPKIVASFRLTHSGESRFVHIVFDNHKAGILERGDQKYTFSSFRDRLGRYKLNNGPLDDVTISKFFEAKEIGLMMPRLMEGQVAPALQGEKDGTHYFSLSQTLNPSESLKHVILSVKNDGRVKHYKFPVELSSLRINTRQPSEAGVAKGGITLNRANDKTQPER